MCIAILNTTGKLNELHIKNSWDNNNQGGGILYNLNGKLTVYKTYNYKEFLKEYNKLRGNNKIKNIVLHFRIATSGHEKYTNLHPFLVNDNLGFVHNGIINGLGNQQYSDTYQFNEYLKTFKHDFLQCQFTIDLLQNFIGWSKLIFLDSQDNATIVGEKDGVWDGANWYSNDSYLSYNDFVYYGNKKQTKEVISGNSKIKDYEYFKMFYTNVTEDNILMLADYVGIDPYSGILSGELEDLAYHYNSYDLLVIIERIAKEFSDEETHNYYSQWES